jgi:hypothetical protein
MAYSELLADRIRQVFKEKKVRFEEKKMMGDLYFLVDSKMCADNSPDRAASTTRLSIGANNCVKLWPWYRPSIKSASVCWVIIGGLFCFFFSLRKKTFFEK